MTREQARTLNRDAKRLVSKYLKGEQYEAGFEKEFLRVYELDPEFIFLNITHAMNLYRINLTMRIIPIHMFGIRYKLRLSSLQ